MIGIASIYVLVFLEPIENFHAGSLIHCFLKDDYKKVNIYDFESSFVLINRSDDYPQLTRVCNDGEQPTDLFSMVIGPLAFGFLLLSILSSLCLQFVGNNYNLLKWSRVICCTKSIVHASLIHDYLTQSHLLEENLKGEMYQIFKESIKSDGDVLNLRDPMFGWTAMHFAVDNALYRKVKN
jgi:hypothetical protein